MSLPNSRKPRGLLYAIMSVSPHVNAAANREKHDWEEVDSLLPTTPVRGNLDVDTIAVVGNGRRARLALYGSHFLSTWGQRAWEFLVGLVMLQVHPSSLLLVSVFGLCDAATIALFGPAIGTLVDSIPRLRAACIMYIVQNVAVFTSAVMCLALLWRPEHFGDTTYWVLVSCAIAAGSVSSLGALGASLSVEREWTKTLSCGDSVELTRMNAIMKRIDLSCLIASPIAVGLIMSWRTDAAVVAVCVWNLAAWLPECALLRRAQTASPALAATQSFSTISSNGQKGIWGPIAKVTSIAGWVEYLIQPASLAAASLALLYLTVMSFGTLMTAYLNWAGIGEVELAVYRGLGALSGIAATLAFPPVVGSLGLVKSGVSAIWVQWVSLAMGAAPLLMKAWFGWQLMLPDYIRIRLLIVGLILSRFGLWAFDLTVNQIIQETVKVNTLGAVTGIQGSLQSLCQMLAYVAGTIVWQPEHFPILIAGSVGIVLLAASTFTAYAFATRCSLAPSNDEDSLEPLPSP